jgi:hypothetical protein
MFYSHFTLQVCLVKPCHDSRYVTCGLKCAEKLCTSGGANATLCDVSLIFKVLVAFRYPYLRFLVLPSWRKTCRTEPM